MTSHNHPLWHRLSQFCLDEPGIPLPFSQRLAREQGWSPDFTTRVIEEYKKFLFLAGSGQGPVTPSKAVDQAWHLHLTYSRSYWDHLCGEVLQRPLHHDPTQGGPDDSDKHARQYQETLARYTNTFGTPPPEDIWTPPGDSPEKCRGRSSLSRRFEVFFSVLVLGLPIFIGLAYATEHSRDTASFWTEIISTNFGEFRSEHTITILMVGSAAVVGLVFLLLRLSIPRSPGKRGNSQGSCGGGCSGGTSCSTGCSGGSSCGGGGCGGGD